MKLIEGCETEIVTPRMIMRRKAFLFGVDDYRTGRSFRPAYENQEWGAQWDYERGRIWAAVAPQELEVMNGRAVNQEAVRMYNEACSAGIIP
jgi:hypothetical protein